MTSFSIRALTQGWSMQQRQELVRSLDDRQKLLVRRRIELESAKADKYGPLEGGDAMHFLVTGEGDSWGIVEFESVCLFGRDPAFVAEYRRIRRMHDAPDVNGEARPVQQSAPVATGIAALLPRSRKRVATTKKKAAK